MAGGLRTLVAADVLPVRRGELALIRRLIASIAVSLLVFGLASAPVAGRTFDPAKIEVDLRAVASGFDNPVLLTNAGDGSGRRFVVEQTGYVRTIEDGAPSGTPFLNVSNRVVCCGERGLLGLAFHPKFATNGRLYVNYTRASDGATVVDEYRVTSNPNNVDENATRRQLLAIAQPYANHNGGGMAFGPDGYLYIGMGDGGSGGDPQDRAQNLNSLLGKMLRIDVNGTSSDKAYRVPATNPYVGRSGLDEIWARGLRNPWRWSFDRVTGDLWIADVGQGAWEEVNRATASGGGGRGANFGWDDMEGRHCYEPMSGCLTAGRALPMVEYAHAVTGTDNCSITGGYVYRGVHFPLLRGGYFFADYCSQRIWVVSSTGPSQAVASLLPIAAPSISSFGQDEDGELYVVSHGGAISRIVELTRYPGTGVR
ncbi:MAG TPA: PQQ-dependent sugar dehydrogenase [Candidatus Limnocylindrales bacterium]|nr:PQQ-dependent sugar dehydrogenase [Candidatus Limnocylindrales bacterium]